MTGFTLPTSRPVTQPWAAEFDDWNGDGIVDIVGGFYHSIGWFGHNGIDFGCFTGDPVEAIADGVIEFAGDATNHYLLSGGGNAILHRIPEYGVWAEYLHLSRFAVPMGSTVKRGQVIGYSGNTGSSTAAHLHLGMFATNTPNQLDGWRGRIDPTPYLYGNLNPDYAKSSLSPSAAIVKEDDMPTPVLHRVSSPEGLNRRLPKGKPAIITSDATNAKHLNFAVGGYGIYNIDCFVSGTKLLDGKKIKGRMLIVQNGKPSGYYPFQCDGNDQGEWFGNGRCQAQVTSKTEIWLELTSDSNEAYVNVAAADMTVTPIG